LGLLSWLGGVGVRRLRPKERVKSAKALGPLAHYPANGGELRTVCQILGR